MIPLAVLCGCSQSVDDRFATACAEQKDAGPYFAKVSAQLCGPNSEYLSPQDKEHLIDTWNKMKAVADRAAKYGVRMDNHGNFVADEVAP